MRISRKSSPLIAIIKAIKNNITIYAAHTNLDNAYQGLNFYVANILSLTECSILKQAENKLYKIITFVPKDYIDIVRNAMLKAGGGHIGNYDNCSFSSSGEGTFKALEGTNPFIGKINELHYEPEYRLEIVVQEHAKNRVINSLIEAHPYEEPAYDIIKLDNYYTKAGSGIIGNLSKPMKENDFLKFTKDKFMIPCLRHSNLTNKNIFRVAICTGAGSFLTNKAIACNADAYITADLKYHDFYIPDNKILLIDAGHYETEQFSCNWFYNIIKQSFKNINIIISKSTKNPINYFQ